MLLIGDLLRRNALVRPDKTAVICENNTMTFCELNDAVNRFANSLLELGVRKGDRIGLLDTNSHLWLVCYFASVKIGAILVPICFWYQGPEIQYAANKAGISTFIVGQDYLKMIDSIKDDLKTVAQYIVIGDDPSGDKLNFHQMVATGSEEEPGVVVDENDPHMILFTSGTTGVPKGAVISQRAYYLNASIFMQQMGANDSSIGMCVYPLFHMGGVMWAIITAYAGLTLVIVTTPPTPEKILSAIQQHRVTHFAAVPTLWRRLLEYPGFDDYDLSSLKLAMGASDAMPKELLEEVLRRTTASSPQLYGLTEGGFPTYLSPEDATRKIGSSGKAHCQVEIQLVDENGNQVRQGEVGEIICLGEHLMSFYWDMPKETENTIKDGWLYTGDLGRFDEDGYLYVVGRKKEMIISGGQNIYPAELDRVLHKHPDIAEAAVFGVPDKEWGEAVFAVVVPNEGASLTEEDIIAFVKKNIASYNKPRYVRFADSLPKTAATGKLQKVQLRKFYMDQLNLVETK